MPQLRGQMPCAECRSGSTPAETLTQAAFDIDCQDGGSGRYSSRIHMDVNLDDEPSLGAQEICTAIEANNRASDRCQGSQVLLCAGRMLENRSYNLATIQFGAVAAGVKSFCAYTFANFAIMAAICKFCSVRATAHAIDGLCRNLRCIVHCAPLLGGAFFQLIVV